MRAVPLKLEENLAEKRMSLRDMTKEIQCGQQTMKTRAHLQRWHFKIDNSLFLFFGSGLDPRMVIVIVIVRSP